MTNNENSVKYFTVEEALAMVDAKDKDFANVPSVGRTLAAEVRRLRIQVEHLEYYKPKEEWDLLK